MSNNNKTIGHIKETTMAYSAIGSSYATMIDLGYDRYKDLLIKNSTAGTVKIRITEPVSGTTNEVTVDSNDLLEFNDFWHSGIVEIKYTSTLTSGSVRLWNW